jgi:hypothetical protein
VPNFVEVGHEKEGIRAKTRTEDQIKRGVHCTNFIESHFRSTLLPVELMPNVVEIGRELEEIRTKKKKKKSWEKMKEEGQKTIQDQS